MSAIPTPLEQAIAAYDDAPYESNIDVPNISAIAREFSVPANTLSKRISGVTTSRSEANIHNQALTPGEEDTLVDYIRRASLSGHPPTPQMVREIAEAIRDNRVLHPSAFPVLPLPPLGKNWIEKFRHRHNIKSVWSRRLDTTRFDASCLENLVPWFTEMRCLLELHKYQPEDIYNMDETGYNPTQTQSTRVLVVDDGKKRKRKGKATKASAARQEWVTTIECISASGCALNPLIIYAAKGGINTRWIPEGGTEGWSWVTSNKGWSSDTLAYAWLQDIFEPSTVPSCGSSSSPSSRHRLLVLDGHGSHVKPRFLGFCMNHAIDVMVLPSHTSAVTQPLDVGVFGPLKAHMARLTDRGATYDHGRVPRQVWASRLAIARPLAMTESNIRVGWKETGLYPFCPERVLHKVMDRPSSSSTPSRQPLGSLSVNNLDFLQSCSASPMKDRMAEIIRQGEADRARLVVMDRENAGLRDAVKDGKKTRAGFNVGSVGMSHFTDPRVIEKAEAAAARTKARQGKGKATEAENEEEGPPGDEYQSYSDLEIALEELERYGDGNY